MDLGGLWGDGPLVIIPAAGFIFPMLFTSNGKIKSTVLVVDEEQQ